MDRGIFIAHVVVIGSGAMGLAAAFHAVKAGHTVEVLEAAREPGGMAAHFDLGGLSIERFYHFVCKSDTPTMELMDELGIRQLLRWKTTSMGIFTGGRLRDWGTPVALMKFNEISLLSRLRYGLFAFLSVRRDRWDALETESARSWITSLATRRAAFSTGGLRRGPHLDLERRGRRCEQADWAASSAT